MARVYWKTKRNVGLILALIALFIVIRIKYYEHKEVLHLPKVHPNEVWEFVADFSNMKFLNPTIVNFNIINESGNYDHWKYTTEYSEYLSHWPYLPNYAVAHFDVKANTNKDTYYIHSTHKTCLIKGLLCLFSESEFKFMHSNSSSPNGAVCEEVIKYQCPVLLSMFCRREVVFQRNAIMTNLRKKFNKIR